MLSLRAGIGFFGHADPGAEDAIKRRIEISFKPGHLDLAQTAELFRRKEPFVSLAAIKLRHGS